MGLTLGQNSKVRTSLRARSPFEEYREKQTHQRHARGDAKAEGGGVALRLPRTAFKQKIRDRFFRIFDAEESYVPRGFAARSRVLSRFVSLAQIGELAHRLSTNLWQSVQNQRERELFRTGSKQLESDYFMKQLCEIFLYWSRGTGSVLCRIALWDYWDAVTSFIGCCEVARETESNFVPQNCAIEQNTIKSQREPKYGQYA